MRRRASAVLVAVAVAALAVSAVACDSGGGGEGGGAAEATSTTGVARIVAHDAAEFERVLVVAGERRVEVPERLWGDLAPLLAARSFSPVEPLASYGLDAPEAGIVYEASAGGSDVTLEIGGTTPDGVFRYVRRAGEETIHLADADLFTPVLTLL
ncbi:MAG TPA: DUF4340 domain-containing protein [Acidimicrobiia bacterium]|nr:DUF4340 domain-containing protein [Acidimicrobiia bacterium]